MGRLAGVDLARGLTYLSCLRCEDTGCYGLYKILLWALPVVMPTYSRVLYFEPNGVAKIIPVRWDNQPEIDYVLYTYFLNTDDVL